MKKHTIGKRIFSLGMISVLLLQLCACAATRKTAYNDAASVAKNAVFSTAADEKASFPVHGKDGDALTIRFSEPTEINTVVLSEKNDQILAYEIAVQTDGEFETIYKQDKVGDMRYCAFETVKTDAVRVTVTQTRENAFTLKAADVLLSKHNRSDFRVTAYMISDRVQNPDSIDPEHMEVITDIMLFGAVTFDEAGHLHYADFEIDGEKRDGKSVLQTAIHNIRNACTDSRMPRLYINILGPDGDVDTKEQKHNTVFQEHADVLCTEIREMLGSFDTELDGVYFDYEYPYKASGWRAYSKFLVRLDAALGDDYKIGAALGPWGGKLSADAKNAVDFYEVMTYDMFGDDADGYHATFTTARNGVAFMQKKGYALEKATLGIPFYGRPLDRSAVWTDYFSSAEKLGRFGNVDDSPIEVTIWENEQNVNKTLESPRYLNGYQMVYDKTAYAYDNGLGGVMVWHYSCDTKAESELSLFEAIGEAIADRQA